MIGMVGRPVWPWCGALCMLLGSALSAAAQQSPAGCDTLCAVEDRSAALETGVTGLSAGYEYVHLNPGDTPWQLATVQVSHRFRPVSVIARANLANRFGRTGAQVELDAYPRLLPRTYAYLNVGAALSESLFPDLRVGAEVYRNLPRAWEASLGLRYLNFASSDVTIYTGSVGKYRGNYYASLRPFVTPGDSGEVSASAHLLVRRYFATANHYVTLRAGGGSSPAGEYAIEELNRLSSGNIGLDGKRPFRNRSWLLWSVGFEREQLSSDRMRNRYELGIGWETRFGGVR